MDFSHVPLKSPELSLVFVLKICFCVKNKLYDAFSWAVLKSHCHDQVFLRSGWSWKIVWEAPLRGGCWQTLLWGAPQSLKLESKISSPWVSHVWWLLYLYCRTWQQFWRRACSLVALTRLAWHSRDLESIASCPARCLVCPSPLFNPQLLSAMASCCCFSFQEPFEAQALGYCLTRPRRSGTQGSPHWRTGSAVQLWVCVPEVALPVHVRGRFGYSFRNKTK